MPDGTPEKWTIRMVEERVITIKPKSAVTVRRTRIGAIVIATANHSIAVVADINILALVNINIHIAALAVVDIYFVANVVVVTNVLVASGTVVFNVAAPVVATRAVIPITGGNGWLGCTGFVSHAAFSLRS